MLAGRIQKTLTALLVRAVAWKRPVRVRRRRESVLGSIVGTCKGLVVHHMFIPNQHHRSSLRTPGDPVSRLPPAPSNASKARIHAFAEDVAAKLAFGPGDPIEPLVSRLGGRIEYRDAIGFEAGVPESIIVESARRFTIFIPSMTSGARDRFTIAHELGHFFLHYPIVSQTSPGAEMLATRWVDQNDPVQQRAEWEANWFAAGFLMPSAPFRQLYGTFVGDITRVAIAFGVSAKAAEIRSKTLGLV